MNKVLNFAHSTVLHVKDDPHLPCPTTIKFHSITHTIQTQHCTEHGRYDLSLTVCRNCGMHEHAHAFHSFCIQSKTDHICHAQYSNYNAATHNTTPCTLKCTIHTHHYPPHCLPQPLILCTQLTNIIIYISGGKMAQDVGMV